MPTSREYQSNRIKDRFLDSRLLKKTSRVVARPIISESTVEQYKPLTTVRPDVLSKDQANALISGWIVNGEARMVARFGTSEFAPMDNYWLGHIASRAERIQHYLYREGIPFPSKRTIRSMHHAAGFFPPERKALEKYQAMILDMLPEVDLLASWVNGEAVYAQQLSNANVCHLGGIGPLFSETPWTKALAGKRVLVVHPFAKTIEIQYSTKRRKLFSDPDLMPEFKLITLPAVQSIGGASVPFHSWFEALDYMHQKASKIDFDVAIIGCGAYGFPLAAHIKRMGKTAVHLGGATQILFGITGARWEESPDFKKKVINEFWVRPSREETPSNASEIEGGCYW